MKLPHLKVETRGLNPGLHVVQCVHSTRYATASSNTGDPDTKHQVKLELGRVHCTKAKNTGEGRVVN